MRWLFLIFIVIPVLEMLVLIEVGGILGSVPTVALVFVTAIIGVSLLRKQGLNTLLSFNEKLNKGELPAQELLSAVFLVLAGAFLLTPGFVTDSLGFVLLVPIVRTRLADFLIEQGMLKAVGGFQSSQFYQFFEEPPSGNVYDAQSSVEKKAERFENPQCKEDSCVKTHPVESGSESDPHSQHAPENNPDKKE